MYYFKFYRWTIFILSVALSSMLYFSFNQIISEVYFPLISCALNLHFIEMKQKFHNSVHLLWFEMNLTFITHVNTVAVGRLKNLLSLGTKKSMKGARIGIAGRRVTNEDLSHLHFTSRFLPLDQKALAERRSPFHWWIKPQTNSDSILWLILEIFQSSIGKT